jgi:hypothetical protein
MTTASASWCDRLRAIDGPRDLGGGREEWLVALMVVHTIVDARVLLLPVGHAVRPRHPHAEA